MRTRRETRRISFLCAFCASARVIFQLGVFLLISGVSFAQSQGAYQVPRQIFVGDPAVLVLPLPSVLENRPDIILTNDLPENEDIDFHRIILEQRTIGSRLMIEFTAFSPGILELPVIEVNGEFFHGLSVTVNSIIDSRSQRILSGATSTLVMPGTALMLYGSMALFVFLFLLVIWFIVKGRILLAEFREKWKRIRLFSGIRKLERRLHKAVIKGTDKRIILDKLSDETRDFLSTLTGCNCRSMTANEFQNLPSESLILMQDDSPFFWGNFFRRCDKLRFSGDDISSQDILRLLAFLRSYFSALEKEKKTTKQTEEEAA